MELLRGLYLRDEGGNLTLVVVDFLYDTLDEQFQLLFRLLGDVVEVNGIFTQLQRFHIVLQIELVGKQVVLQVFDLRHHHGR